MIKRFLDALDRAVDLLVAAILCVILVIALMQVFNRFVLNASLSWSEEAQIFGHIWIVFLGIAIAYRKGAHLYVETFCDKLPARGRSVFNLAIELLWAAFAVSMAVLGFKVAQIAHLQESPGLEWPMSFPYAGMVAGGAYLLVSVVRRLAGRAWRVAA